MGMAKKQKTPTPLIRAQTIQVQHAKSSYNEKSFYIRAHALVKCLHSPQSRCYFPVTLCQNTSNNDKTFLTYSQEFLQHHILSRLSLQSTCTGGKCSKAYAIIRQIEILKIHQLKYLPGELIFELQQR